MSVVFSGNLSGSFISNGAMKFLPFQTGVDWITVYNESQMMAAGGTGYGVEFYWRTDFPKSITASSGGASTVYGMVKNRGASDIYTPGYLTAASGFQWVDSTKQALGPAVTLTAIDTSAHPVVSAATTGLIADYSVVKIYSTLGALQFGGMDFTVTTVTGGTFVLAFAPQIAAGTTGSYRIVPYDPIFYPRTRYITAITQASSAVVTFSVTHGYQIGQKLTFHIPQVSATTFGMTELDGITATVTAINTTTNTVTINVDSSGFTAFAFPLTTDNSFTPAHANPAGMDTAVALSNNVSYTSDATINQGTSGLLLMPGVTDARGPAGFTSGDQISWIAHKSYNK
jgi:hypothetical protein